LQYQDHSQWQQPSPRQRHPLPASAAPGGPQQESASRQPPSVKHSGSVGAVVAIPITGLVLALLGYVVAIPLLMMLGLLVLVGGIIAVIVRLATGSGPKSAPAQPIAYTDDGRPIYPVVGYTADGAAITADRAVGYQPMNPRTNSLAIAALVLGFVFPLLAIPFGHAARSQIRRTGEQGAGLALAGLILGYLNVVVLVVVLVVILGLGRGY